VLCVATVQQLSTIYNHPLSCIGSRRQYQLRLDLQPTKILMSKEAIKDLISKTLVLLAAWAGNPLMLQKLTRRDKEGFGTGTGSLKEDNIVREDWEMEVEVWM